MEEPIEREAVLNVLQDKEGGYIDPLVDKVI